MTFARVLALGFVAAGLIVGPASAARPPPTPQPPLLAPDVSPPPEGLPAPTRPVSMSVAATGVADPTDPSDPKVLSRAKACLRRQADAASRAEASAKLAADLLLENLCAPEVEAASRYERNVAALARFTPQSERARAGLAVARVDEESGDIVNPPNVDVLSALRETEPDVDDGRPSAALRRFAAEQILLARPRAPAPRKPR